MEGKKIEYQFTAKAYQDSSSGEVGGWTIVSLPKEMSKEIRDHFQWLEEGWGRMKVTARTDNNEWRTSIWFDTKQGTYLLPLKAEIRKKELIAPDQIVNMVIRI